MASVPQRILIFLLSGIGDTLMFTPALRRLRAAWPSSRITALTMRPGERDLVALNGDLDEVRYWPFLEKSFLENLRYGLSLRRDAFDVSILPCPSNRVHYNGLSFLAGASQRVAFRYREEGGRNLDFLNTTLLPHELNVHNVEHNLQLVEYLTGEGRVLQGLAKPHLVLSCSEDDRRLAKEFLQSRNLEGPSLIGLHISSSRAKQMTRKCWPRESFLSLVRQLAGEDDRTPFLLFCGGEDLPDSEWLVQQAGNRLQLVRDLPIRVVAEIIRLCSVLVTNDSGLMHVATAVRTPTVAIFGPTHPMRTGPWNAPAEVVRTGINCSPCFYHTSRDLDCPAGLNFACLREISVDKVLSAVRKAASMSRA